MSQPDTSARGVQASTRRSPLAAVGTWFERHAQTLVASLGKLIRQPFSTTLTVGVIALGLALPACLHLVVLNASTVTRSVGGSVQLSVYLKMQTTAEQAAKVRQAIAAREEVLEARLVTPDEGLKQFESLSGFGDALKALQDNPLPYAIIVRPTPQYDSAQAIDSLAAELRALPETDIVQADTEWVRRLDAILAVLGKVVMLAALLLGAGVLAIVGNTVRLDINGRREEIEVIKLVGGSNAFVRRPFLYTGTWYGLGGGLLAWLLVTAAVGVMAGPVEHVAMLYGSTFRLQGLDPRAVLALIGGGTVLGWLGSWLTASYHLRRIEPRS